MEQEDNVNIERMEVDEEIVLRNSSTECPVPVDAALPSSLMSIATSDTLPSVVNQVSSALNVGGESEVSVNSDPSSLPPPNDLEDSRQVVGDKSASTVSDMENNDQQTNTDESKNNSSSCPGEKRLGHSSRKYLQKDEMKFMANFNPSQRMERKRLKKYTEFGVVIERCDCLIPTCPGCFLPCKICKSTRCGHQCREGRLWDYEEIEVQGRNIFRRLTDAEK
ncbi:ARL14 effector protein-like [Orchesella cincta]|uniref:ARL14 effector protein-like n=1 Tax=Orchesella cincta TaxID=48709 RepID=A0A1D2NJ34_ORCCI|nr:ARL14 effector protein-like [Orchesella cincta]